MPMSLNVIALISGGKDSFYSLLHCIQNGHKIVALANLYPTQPTTTSEEENGEGDDINSFMYQTVGHSIIPLYASALDLPLYRQQISGLPIQTSRDYDSSQTENSPDETEDLVPLLKKVLQNHPEANAVCSGAILSTYQRTRIESVALRLGLIPLAYLWQYSVLPHPVPRPDSLIGLLEDMRAACCDSRVIKIASGGMQESLLWSNVANSWTSHRILSGMAPFFEDDELGLRGAVLGEGGEYETLAVDGPHPVWKRRIAIDDSKNVVASQEGGVMWLKLGPAKVVEKQEENRRSIKSDLVRRPGIFDPQFSNITSKLAHENSQDVNQEVPTSRSALLESSEEKGKSSALEDVIDDHGDKPYNPQEWCLPSPPPNNLLELKPSVKLSRSSSILTISNVTAPECHGGAAHQASHIITILQTIIHSISTENSIIPPVSPSDIIFTTILLASMSDFTCINIEYSKLFTHGTPNPPSRVTVSCGYSLPSNTSISLSVAVALKPQSQSQPTPRRALHVQSRSYWAPANIGPYSQATCTATPAGGSRTEFVHLAGQIPLVPATMEVLEGSFVEQVILGLQHLWRVGQERSVDCWAWGIAFLPRQQGSESDRQARVATAAGVWREAHWTTTQGKPVAGSRPHGEEPVKDEDDDEGQTSEVDAWDLKHNRSGRGSFIPTAGAHLHVLPNQHAVSDPTDRPWVPPVVVAEVEELPRSAPVEWHGFGLGSLPKYPAGRPRVQVMERRYDWGSVGVCSFLEERDISEMLEGTIDGDNVKLDHHFITLLVSKAPKSAEKDVHIEIPTLQEILPNISQHTSSLDEHSVVQGTAYLSRAEGRVAFASLGGEDAMPGITVIPSRRLWGCCEGVQRNDDEAAPQRLSLAVTLRVDAVAVGSARAR